jgi:hypothetical protein
MDENILCLNGRPIKLYHKLILILLLLFASFFFANSSFSQSILQTVKGKVTDKETKETLPGAAVILNNSDTTIVTTTDTSGIFTFDVPVGRQSFSVSYTGYENLSVPDELITTGKEVVLNIEMRESITTLKDVVISTNKMQAINSMSAASVHILRPDDAARYAGGLYDPSRMVSSFAGVGAVDVDLNEIVIRGNSPKGILWRLEGIEIPNPNHFPDGQGGSGGSLSMITSDMLSTFDFLTGAFPAEYGNATSGVIDLNLRKGNPDTQEGTILVGDVGTQGTIEGPFAKGYKGSYLINYRYATLSLVDKLHIANLGDNNVPSKFQDLSFEINLPTNYFGNFELFGVGGNNSTGSIALKDSIHWNTWDDRRDEHEEHNLGILGAKYQYNFPNKRTYLKIVTSATTQYDLWDKGYIVQNYYRQTEHKEDYKNKTIRTSMVINHSFGARSSIRGGIIYSNLQANMFEENYLWQRKEFEINIDTVGNTKLWQTFIQSKYRFSNRLEFYAGVHSMKFILNGNYAIEPRLSLKYQVGNNQVLTFGSGLHSRIEALPLYYASVNFNNVYFKEGNKNIGLSKAFHNVVGYEFNPDQYIRLKAEAYYQYLFNVPVAKDTANNFSTINLAYGLSDYLLTNKGLGHNYGMEFTFEKLYESNYYCLATISIFNSKYRLSDNKWYNTNYNCNYISNFLIGKDFKIGKRKINTFGLNLKTGYRGGLRATPIDLNKSILADRAIYLIDQTNSKRLPDVFELNLGANYRNNSKGFAWIISADIQNVLNHENILVYEYRGSNQQVVTVKGIGIVPVVNFRIEF